MRRARRNALDSRCRACRSCCVARGLRVGRGRVQGARRERRRSRPVRQICPSGAGTDEAVVGGARARQWRTQHRARRSTGADDRRAEEPAACRGRSHRRARRRLARAQSQCRSRVAGRRDDALARPHRSCRKLKLESNVPGLLPDVDPDGLLEYSVVYTDRALNHMSRAFQRVMNEVADTLESAYRAKAAVIVPGSGTFGMEAVARQFATRKRCLVVRNGWFSYRWSQIFEMGDIPAATTVLKARRIGAGPQAPFAPAPIDDIVGAIKDERPDL